MAARVASAFLSFVLLAALLAGVAHTAAGSNPAVPASAGGGHPLAPGLAHLGDRVGPATTTIGAQPTTAFAATSGYDTDPYDYYSAEPAPMGVADYGVTSAGAGGYTYFAPAVQGVITLSSNVAVENASLGAGSPYLGFQLNAMMVFSIGSGPSFTYWVQDVVLYNTSDDVIDEFIDNVWNESGTGDQMYNSTISGNGTVLSGSGGDWYAAGSNESQPGGVGQSWAAPNAIVLEMDAFETDDGQPGVAFLYGDGYGEYAYDVAYFPWATQLNDFYGFVVTGTEANPIGSPYDLELTMGGPGGGSQTYQEAGNVKLQLLAWNGYNFQTPANAFDFGSETAEGSENVQGVGEYNLVSGNLTSHLIAGSGSYATLHQLWAGSSVGVLNFSGSTQDGTLFVNGTPTPFEGGTAVLTLEPGQYFINVSLAGGTPSYLGRCILGAGETLNISLADTCSGGTGGPSGSTGTNPLLGSIAGLPVYVLLILVVVVVAIVVAVAVARRRPARPSGPPTGYPVAGYGPSAPAPGASAPWTGATGSPPPAYVPAPTYAAAPPAAMAPPPRPTAPPPAGPVRPCPRCGTVIPYSSLQCPRCGLYFAPAAAGYAAPGPAPSPAPPAVRPYSPPAAAPPAAPAPPVTAPAPATPAARFCPNCGTPAAADAAFCHKCGFDFSRVNLAPR